MTSHPFDVHHQHFPVRRTRCEKCVDSICDQCLDGCLEAARDQTFVCYTVRSLARPKPSSKSNSELNIQVKARSLYSLRRNQRPPHALTDSNSVAYH